ncbi:MAG: chromosomal replication initiator protein DnaA, partial [candidate division WS6 bacterium 34_10]
MNKVDIENYKDTLPKPDLSNNSVSTDNSIDPDDTWKAVKEVMRLKIDNREFKTWFNDVYIENISNGVVEFSCANDVQKDAIVRDYLQTLKESIEKTTGINMMLNFTIRSEQSNRKKGNKYEYYTASGEESDSSKTLFSDLDKQREEREKAISKAQLNPKYTFDNFVVGSHNRLAEAVASAVVEELGVLYNPVFFYGNTGVGKTHLMQAIGNEVIKKDAQKQVVYVSIEQFLNEMITSIRSKKEQAFREKYRKVDLLIIDDIQFVESYPKTQEALFHTFNTLYQSNKQIVLAADRPPREIKNLTDRLRSRFEGGMVADIG